MRTLARATAVLVCVAALLSALPVQAAPSHRSHSTPAPAAASWLGSVWADLARFVTARPGAPAVKGHKSLTPKGGGIGQGGSCIDPNGAPTCGLTLLVAGH